MSMESSATTRRLTRTASTINKVTAVRIAIVNRESYRVVRPKPRMKRKNASMVAANEAKR
jgi:hypothetical protein